VDLADMIGACLAVQHGICQHVGFATEHTDDKGGKGTGQCPLIGLIEDELDLVAMSRAHLERDGSRVVEALDARSGLAVMRREPVDLIVLDLRLPDSNGLDVLRTLRSTSDARELELATVSHRGGGLAGDLR
jgi:hypothetical protein